MAKSIAKYEVPFEVQKAFSLRLAGYTYPQIAKQVRRTKESVANWFHPQKYGKHFIDYAQKKLATFDEDLIKLAPKIYIRLNKLLDSSDDMTILRAIDIWNRMVGKYTKEQIVKKVTVEKKIAGLSDKALGKEITIVKAELTEVKK